jgi:serine/threonine protein kinase
VEVKEHDLCRNVMLSAIYDSLRNPPTGKSKRFRNLKNEPSALFNYKVLKKIGGGDHAAVFLANKIDENNKKYILKISVGKEMISHTDDEYKVMKSFASERIPKVLGVIIDTESSFSIISMEYSKIDTNLLQYVTENGCLEEEDMKQVMKQLLEALKYIHGLGYTHREVKPDKNK